MRKNRALWREIVRSLKPMETEDHWTFEKADPPLREQLRQSVNYMHGLMNTAVSEREERYLNAVKNAQHAAASTKRKWRKTLGLSN